MTKQDTRRAPLTIGSVRSVKTRTRLTELQHVVDHIRAREQREPDAMRREEWRAVRGGVHQALAARNSRLALYDLRDSLMDADHPVDGHPSIRVTFAYDGVHGHMRLSSL